MLDHAADCETWRVSLFLCYLEIRWNAINLVAHKVRSGFKGAIPNAYHSYTRILTTTYPRTLCGLTVSSYFHRKSWSYLF